MNRTSDDDLRIGEQFYLECTFIGQPPPEVVWSQNGTILSETPMNGIKIISNGSSSHLDIHATSMNFNGDYECFVSNVAGNVSQSFQIQLKEGQ